MSENPHVLIVEAPYYTQIAEALRRGALRVLEEAGVGHEIVTVPGAFEIPAAIQFALRARDFSSRGKRFDGFIALGCVIRGETTHYDYVCGESARGLQDLALRNTLAIGYGILTVENEEQAWARADPERRDKGGEAARACLEMIALKKSFGLFPR